MFTTPMKYAIRTSTNVTKKYAEADVSLRGALYQLDSENNGKRKFVTDMSLAIQDNEDKSFHDMELPGGLEKRDYLLQLHLPDGDIINKTFSYDGSEGKPLKIDLPSKGKHKELAWQSQVRGNQPLVFTSDASPLSEKVSAPPEVYLVSLSVLMSEAQNQFEYCSQLIALEEQPDFNLHLLPDPLEPQSNMEGALLFIIDDEVAKLLSLESCNDRPILIVKTESDIRWMTIPYPWKYGAENITTEVLLSPQKSGFEVSISMQHPMINSALGYLHQGARFQAANLLGAKIMLFNKFDSPMSAALAGYVLFQSFSREKVPLGPKKEDWFHWINNLSTNPYFTWLPDGAILQAALYTYFNVGDRDKAYDAAMTAYQRGLPYFSFGLELLLEVMYHFANEGEGYSSAANCIVHLEKIATKTDTTNTFSLIQVAKTQSSKGAFVEFEHD
ncbi:hypothetical protein KUL106_36330 [Alteromonas sp. KUL106]|nr:hypothetical protein KUL106_36330 [Alteromonas sp. KUL106]